MSTVIGTAEYMAPELLKILPGVNYPADLWAVGAMVFRLLTKDPFLSDRMALINYCTEPDKLFPRKPLEMCKVSQDGQIFIQALMRPEPEERPDSRAALNHAWIRPCMPISQASSDESLATPSGRSSSEEERGLTTQVVYRDTGYEDTKPDSQRFAGFEGSSNQASTREDIGAKTTRKACTFTYSVKAGTLTATPLLEVLPHGQMLRHESDDIDLSWDHCLWKFDDFGWVTSLAFSNDSKFVASGTSEGIIEVRNAFTDRLIQRLEGHDMRVYSVAFSNDSKIIASGSADEMMKIWDVATGCEVQRLKHRGWVYSIAFSNDSKLIASGSGDRTIRIWNAATRRLVQTLKGHDGAIRSISFSNDSKLIASVSDDDVFKTWDATTGCEIQTVKGPSVSVLPLALSNDWKLVASCSRGDMKVWDATTGRLVQTLKSNDGGVVSGAFSADSKLVALGSSSTNGTIKISDATTGREVQMLKGHNGCITSISFSNDSRLIAVGCGNSLKIWGRSLDTQGQ
ncbi:hypothetical protein FOTG_19112 [Fusarium oxysporum f. sp. vasinfectum 25433]|uniref:Mitochondrial division protein 1 n=1 Tax=Fusarium oxysporum f. sp. vasinfectum 25433 TaxID=1089449 RepID=X0KUD2_FUSOX|nr:hypothetical protein FOTG_19112 [Fusarium oxysporum f. sp. vasinfectum 25433]